MIRLKMHILVTLGDINLPPTVRGKPQELICLLGERERKIDKETERERRKIREREKES